MYFFRRRLKFRLFCDFYKFFTVFLFFFFKFFSESKKLKKKRKMQNKNFVLPKLHQNAKSLSSSQSPGENLINEIDLRKKRTSENKKALSPGVPFLHPADTEQDPLKRNKKSFFFQQNQSINTREVLKNILKEVNLLPNQAVFQICRTYNLAPASHATLYRFVSDFSPNDRNAVILLSTLFKEVTAASKPKIVMPRILTSSVTAKPMILPKFAQIENYGFFDPRYSHSEHETLIMREPIVIAGEATQFTMQMPGEPIGTHIIIQCLSADGKISWPCSLQIIVNDVLIKGPGVCRLNQIDMTNFPCAKVTFHCNRENNISGLIIRPAAFSSFKAIVTALSQQHSPADKKPTEYEQAICPLTGKLLKYPGRGVSCKHLQCFNLKAYIKRATATKQWVCPICNQPCPFNQLIYSHEMENVINRAKELPEHLQQQQEFNEFADDVPPQLDIFE